MIVMGGIVGSGIFINPDVVAQQVHTPFLILGVWVAGGVLAMLGAFIWAELATRLPGAGGQYLYLREAYHPGGRVRLRLGAAAGDADRRDGGGRRDVRALLPRDQRRRRGATARSRRPCCSGSPPSTAWARAPAATCRAR